MAKIDLKSFLPSSEGSVLIIRYDYINEQDKVLKLTLPEIKKKYNSDGLDCDDYLLDPNDVLEEHIDGTVTIKENEVFKKILKEFFQKPGPHIIDFLHHGGISLVNHQYLNGKYTGKFINKCLVDENLTDEEPIIFVYRPCEAAANPELADSFFEELKDIEFVGESNVNNNFISINDIESDGMDLQELNVEKEAILFRINELNKILVPKDVEKLKQELNELDKRLFKISLLIANNGETVKVGTSFTQIRDEQSRLGFRLEPIGNIQLDRNGKPTLTSNRYYIKTKQIDGSSGELKKLDDPNEILNLLDVPDEYERASLDPNTQESSAIATIRRLFNFLMIEDSKPETPITKNIDNERRSRSRNLGETKEDIEEVNKRSRSRSP